MKKAIILILCIIMAVIAAGCGGNASDKDGAVENKYPEYSSVVKKAQNQIKKAWEDQFTSGQGQKPYVKITNTRIIKLKAEPVNVSNNNEPVRELEGIDMIVEFMMLSNYYSDSYYDNVASYDTVIIKSNGSMEVPAGNPIRLARSRYFLTDFSGIIEEVIDLEDTYSGELF